MTDPTKPQRFDAKGMCLRHGELVCPSCLQYALNDAEAEATQLREALRKVAEHWDPNRKATGKSGTHPTCMVCGGYPWCHAADCFVHAALAPSAPNEGRGDEAD